MSKHTWLVKPTPVKAEYLLWGLYAFLHRVPEPGRFDAPYRDLAYGFAGYFTESIVQHGCRSDIWEKDGSGRVRWKGESTTLSSVSFQRCKSSFESGFRWMNGKNKENYLNTFFNHLRLFPRVWPSSLAAVSITENLLGIRADTPSQIVGDSIMDRWSELEEFALAIGGINPLTRVSW